MLQRLKDIKTVMASAINFAVVGYRHTGWKMIGYAVGHIRWLKAWALDKSSPNHCGPLREGHWAYEATNAMRRLLSA